MSYILDALRKAEEQRRLGQLPDVLDVSATGQEEPQHKKVWVLLFASVLLFISVAMLAWLYTREQQDPLKNASVVARAHQPGVSKNIIVEQKQEPPVSQRSERVISEPPDEVASPVMSGRDEAVMTAKPPTAPLTDSAEDVIRLAKEQGWIIIGPNTKSGLDKTITQSEVEEKPVVSVSQLPPTSRERLPRIEYTGHFFSPEPQLSKVTINNRTIGEGQEISAGLVLHEITPYGAVFAYEEHLFSLAMFQHWP